jgi:hypothetical protein
MIRPSGRCMLIVRWTGSTAVTVAVVLVVCSARAAPGDVVTLDAPLVCAGAHGAIAKRAAKRGM